MRDAISETYDLTVLMVVIFIVCMIIAFAVNYSKAYRMKEHALSVLEKSNCSHINMKVGEQFTLDDDDKADLEAEAKRIGYSPSISNSESGEKISFSGVTIIPHISNHVDSNGHEFSSLTVITYVGLDIPFVNKIFDFGYMKLTGETSYCKTITNIKTG